MNFLSKLPDDIIYFIIDNTNIKCHTCNRKFNIYFYKNKINIIIVQIFPKILYNIFIYLIIAVD